MEGWTFLYPIYCSPNHSSIIIINIFSKFSLLQSPLRLLFMSPVCVIDIPAVISSIVGWLMLLMYLWMVFRLRVSFSAFIKEGNGSQWRVAVSLEETREGVIYKWRVLLCEYCAIFPGCTGKFLDCTGTILNLDIKEWLILYKNGKEKNIDDGT